jgi:hypothetical protein
MLEQLKNILDENQAPKAIGKITNKFLNLLMTNEETSYIAIQKN